MTDKAKQLRELLIAGTLMSTREMCIALGWQGGTIHQVAFETRLSVDFLLTRQKV
jgi:hypothetical protein